MLMMFEKGIKGRTCHAMHRYAKKKKKISIWVYK